MATACFKESLSLEAVLLAHIVRLLQMNPPRHIQLNKKVKLLLKAPSTKVIAV